MGVIIDRNDNDIMTIFRQLMRDDKNLPKGSHLLFKYLLIVKH